MKRMISACLRFEAPDLWLAVPAALFPVLVVEVTALMIAATEDDPEALVLLPGVGMILTVVLCCVLGVVYLCSNFPLLLQFSASRRGSLAGAVPAYSADDRTGRSDRRCSYYGSWAL